MLTARDDWRLIGVLPLYRYDEAECCKLLPIGIGLSDYLDVLVEPDHSEVVAALFESLVELPRWEECYIPDLPPGAALLAAQFPAQLMEHRVMSGTCPVLALPSAVAGLPRGSPTQDVAGSAAGAPPRRCRWHGGSDPGGCEYSFGIYAGFLPAA